MMKKVILFISIVVILFNSCSFFESSDQRNLQEQINQLQQEVAVLQKTNGLTPSYEIKNDSIASSIVSDSSMKNKGRKQTNKETKEGKEQLAVEAIKYCLKMYVPELNYTNIRSVPKSDGTIDVIIDYTLIGSVEHNYYNVTVYPNNEFKVNSCRGLEGTFPYNSKFSIK